MQFSSREVYLLKAIILELEIKVSCNLSNLLCEISIFPIDENNRDNPRLFNFSFELNYSLYGIDLAK